MLFSGMSQVGQGPQAKYSASTSGHVQSDGPALTQPSVRRWVGKSVKVKEDRRFVQGEGLYSDDIQLKQMLYAAVLRSPHAHAKVRGVDVSRATRLKGVVATLTGRELAKLTNPMR